LITKSPEISTFEFIETSLCSVVLPVTANVDDIVAALETLSVDFIVEAFETSKVELIVAALETLSVDFIVAAFETSKVEFNVEAPPTVIVDAIVAALETFKVDFMVDAVDTVNVCLNIEVSLTSIEEVNVKVPPISTLEFKETSLCNVV